MPDEIKRLQNELICAAQHARGCGCVTFNPVLEDSEIIAAYEAAIEALERQIPKPPICENKFGIFKDLTRCPNCGAGFEAYYRHGGREYCAYCGQRLDWSEVEG